MSKFTVCVTTYIVIEADDLESAHEESENVRSAVALTVLDGHELEDQVIDVEVASVYEVEEV